MKTAQQIRKALIQITERNNRPHYTAMVVRDVLDAFRNNLDHPLKSAVDEEKVILSIVDEPKLAELKDFCLPRGMREILAEISGFSVRRLFAYTSHELILTESAWIQLKEKFPKALKEYQKIQIQTKKIRALTEKYCGTSSAQGGAV